MTFSRIRYRERQRLRVVDLQGEQASRIFVRRWHNVRQHTWGIVRGLQLAREGHDLLVKPGVAVDGFGRELLVMQGLRISESDLDAMFAETSDATMLVWLLYARSAGANRWQESIMLRFTPASEKSVNKKDDLLPDDPAAEWPVPLGAVTRKGNPRVSGRLYTRLVGNSVTGVSGRSGLRLRPRQFSLSVKDQQALTERLVLDERSDDTDDNAAAFYGNLHLEGDPGDGEALILGVSQRDVVGIGFESIAPEQPPQPRPWQIYRTVTGEAPSQRDQLVIALFHPGRMGDAADYQLILGATPPGITVKADGTLVIHGDLQLDGDLLLAPREPDLNDPDYVQALAESWAQGAQLTKAELDRLYDPGGTSRLEVAIRAPNPIETNDASTYTVVVTNTGQVELPNVVVTLFPIFNSTIEQNRILEQFQAIPPGQSVSTQSVAFNRPNPGKLRLFVSAGSINAQNQVTDQSVDVKNVEVVVGPGDIN